MGLQTLLILLPLLVVVRTQFMPPQQYPYYQPQTHSMPNPLSPGGQGMPMQFNMPSFPGSPIHPPIQMPPTMQLPLNGGRLPMVIQPHRSKKKEKKKTKKHRKHKHRRIRLDSRISDDSQSSDSDFEFRSHKAIHSSKSKRRQVLTPVISYVTNDGYVVYQKKIKKDKAKDWLELSKKS